MRIFLLGALVATQALSASLKNDTILDMTAGYRQDAVRFSYTEDSSPSFFKADPLKAFTLGLKLKYALEEHWYLRGFTDFGWIVSGRSHMHTSTFLSSGEGHLFDIGGALGYTAFVWTKCSLAPLLGWGYERLKTDPSHTDTPAVRHFKSSLNGPFIGLDLVCEPSIHCVLDGTYTFQVADERLWMRIPHTPTVRARSAWGAYTHFFLLGLWYRSYIGWRFGIEGECLLSQTFKHPRVHPASIQGTSARWTSYRGLLSVSYDF